MRDPLRQQAILVACRGFGDRPLAELRPTRSELESVRWLMYFYVDSPLGAALQYDCPQALEYMRAVGVKYPRYVVQKMAEFLQPDAPEEMVTRARPFIDPA